jgi:hypothetical protein
LQWLSIKADWEPRLIRSLGRAAEDCLALLRQDLAAAPIGGDDASARRVRLGRAMAKVVAQRSEEAKGLLREMVLAVAEETGVILTLNGLAGTPPKLGGAHGDSRRAAEALARGPALDESVAKGFLGFAGEVFAALEKARAGEMDPAALTSRLDALGQSWRKRLEMTARTVLHAAFNDAKHAVSEGLR